MMKFAFLWLLAIGLGFHSSVSLAQKPQSYPDGNWEEFVDDSTLGKSEPEWEPWSPYRVLVGLGWALPSAFKFNVQSLPTDGILKINNGSSLNGNVQILATLDQHLSLIGGLGLTSLRSDDFKTVVAGVETKHSGTSALDILDLNLGLALEWQQILLSGSFLYPFITKRTEAYGSLKGHLSSKASLGYFITPQLLVNFDAKLFTFTQDTVFQNQKIHGRASIYPVMSLGLQYVF